MNKNFKSVPIRKQDYLELCEISKVLGKSKCQILSETLNALTELLFSFETASITFDVAHDCLMIKAYGKKKDGV